MPSYPESEEDAGGGESTGKRLGKIIAIAVGVVLVFVIVLLAHHAGK